LVQKSQEKFTQESHELPVNGNNTFVCVAPVVVVCDNSSDVPLNDGDDALAFKVLPGALIPPGVPLPGQDDIVQTAHDDGVNCVLAATAEVVAPTISDRSEVPATVPDTRLDELIEATYDDALC
jgi:hypothetical protein